MKGSVAAFGALAMLTCLVFLPALDPASVFYFRDVSQNHHPYRALTLSMISEGEAPLWNPHRGAGQPLLANPNALVLHPTTLLFLILPFEAAFKLSIILQVMMAAFATWLLLRDIGTRAGPALLGASLFAFSGTVISLGNLINLLDSVAFMPLTLWLAGRAMSRGFAPWGSLAALSLAVQIVAGEPSVLICTAAAFVCLHWSVPRRDARSAAARAAGIAGMVLLAGALSMAGTLPALELIARAERSEGFDREESLKWSLPPLALAEAAIPHLFGDPTRTDAAGYWGGRLFDSGLPFLLSIYLGPGALILAGIGLGRGLSAGDGRRRRETLALAGLSAAGLALSLGRFLPVYPFLQSLAPPLESVRYPVKYFVLVSWAVSLLAARGCERLFGEGRGGRTLAGAAAAGGAAGIAVAAAGLALVHWSPSMASLMGSRPEAVLSSLHGSIARCAVVAAVISMLCLAGRSRLSRLGLIVIPVIDVAAASIPLNPVAPSDFYSEPPLLAPLLRAEDPARLWAMPRPQGFAFRTPAARDPSSLRWGFRWDRMTLRNATYFPERVDFAYDRGNERLDVMPGASVGRLLYENAGSSLPASETARLLFVAGVSHVISYGDLGGPGFSEAGRLEGESVPPVVLLRSAASLPRAYFVERAEVEPDAVRALRRLRSSSFDPAGEVIIEESAPHPASTGDGASPPLISIDHGGASRVSITASTDRPGWLVLSDTYYPGWQAIVDGEEAPIVRANAMFRAVPLGAGRHEVEFLFRPGSVRSGAMVSALGLILAGFLAWPRRR